MKKYLKFHEDRFIQCWDICIRHLQSLSHEIMFLDLNRVFSYKVTYMYKFGHYTITNKIC